jgi:hypothetical protein
MSAWSKTGPTVQAYTIPLLERIEAGKSIRVLSSRIRPGTLPMCSIAPSKRAPNRKWIAFSWRVVG